MRTDMNEEIDENDLREKMLCRVNHELKYHFNEFSIIVSERITDSIIEYLRERYGKS